MERRLPGSLDASQKQSRLQHSKNLSNIITAEFYINGNFQLSHSSVSMRGPEQEVFHREEHSNTVAELALLG